MIELKQLTKHYGKGNRRVNALSGLNLSIKRGEIFGVIGHSGAGKSTLIRCINLLERPTSGEVWVDGVNLATVSQSQLQKQRRKIGMIFQHFNLLSSATVYDNIAFPLRLVNTPREKLDMKVRELLELVGLEEHSGKYPSQLSGGQKQRVGIARALASDPHVLLCDEATSALDPQTTGSILKLLLDINQRFNLTIVLITHEMHVIQSICDRVGVIHQGDIVEQGPVAEVFLKPQHQVTKDFIQRESEHPEELQAAIAAAGGGESAQVVRISFLGSKTYDAILSRTARSTGVDFAILQGTISTIKNVPYGQLIVRFEGNHEDIEQTLREVSGQGLDVEVIGQ
ncbi:MULTISPECIES: methionine ABC transporter ATP-binding protein [Paenibacillus]|uniref:Methionine ABC transporter ATP-binding protein n=2 Tax=Paenibacillus TaxID=44249 RepID=A0ABX2Z6A5_PAEPO|nr:MULTISPECIES: ATP-binding cassette domain-containing protein [Paenibacillus]APB74463.1 methionine ABC transporter ATP-binding protein [Paenibacillus polymyxa]MDR6779652.1 D-methionine transport system ATP-binding protein [Paenibacillus peoriae]ODA06743.1 methionine ABC transporter ATP-binding protein [Paenibacillus polymyxa]OME70866.1 methionine ABC transporter ATP-binding protein [Paenibacillus peoriae]OMF77728.1 methionine ABC transporter ATP-binding protein [Paenibacillus peoriae]